jgi:hypothetical protein
MKTILLILVFFISGYYVNAQEVLTLSIDKINSKTLSRGDTIPVRVYMEQNSFELSTFQLFFKYDANVIEYIKTNLVNKKFTENWHDNVIQDLFAAVYVDVNKSGFSATEKIAICELNFIYKGGETDLMFGKESVIEQEVRLNGETKFTTLTNANLPLNLIHGCVCELE